MLLLLGRGGVRRVRSSALRTPEILILPKDIPILRIRTNRPNLLSHRTQPRLLNNQSQTLHQVLNLSRSPKIRLAHPKLCVANTTMSSPVKIGPTEKSAFIHVLTETSTKRNTRQGHRATNPIMTFRFIRPLLANEDKNTLQV